VEKGSSASSWEAEVVAGAGMKSCRGKKERFSMKANLAHRSHTIEWRHLEVKGETCDRCAGTCGNILEAIKSLERSGELEVIQVEVIDTALTKDRIGELDTVLINDIPIEQLVGAGVQYTECSSCGDLIGNPTCCRAVTSERDTEEILPTEIIRAAIARTKEQG
jgi:hypothetical protein